MASTVSAHVTVIVPQSKLEDEIIRLNSEGFTVVRAEILEKNIKLFASRIFMQRYDNEQYDTREGPGDY